MVIYKIAFKQIDKFYIGSAMRFSIRKLAHLGTLRKGIHRNIHLQRCYDKYGENSMFFEILEEVNAEEKLITTEQKWIDTYEWNKLLNICPIAGNTLGRKHTEEAKKKISQNHHDVSGEKNPMYGLTGSLSPNYGRKHTEETKRKISEGNKGKQKTLGYKHTEEAKKKIGENWKGRKHKEGSKKKMSLKRLENSRKNGGQKLTLEKAREIRDRRSNGETITKLAKEFGISRTYCGLVIREIYWPEKLDK
jgi:group I intron endonuclease